MAKLYVKAFGLALGILWGGGLLFMGVLANFCSWALPFVGVLSVMYVGYDTGIAGCLIGTAWGFLDGAIGGVVFAWLYNKLAA